MNTKPILFSAPMVRALLDNSKTQTRRIVKFPMRCTSANVGGVFNLGRAGLDWFAWLKQYPGVGSSFTCPYGKPGDRLWVRETHAILTGNGHRTVYAADGRPMTEGGKTPVDPMRWTPSIFMPRHLSRITLEITDVRVQRLQEISAADCFAEGIVQTHPEIPKDPQIAYRELWESINGPGSWAANPWVWAVSFRTVAA